MNIIHTLELDLQRHDSRQFIYCKQGDSETRSVEISLYNNGSTWKVPEDASIIRICYAKPDRTGGLYDRMPDGSNAGEKSGNKITANLHPQMFAVSGTVAAEVILITDTGAQLATFNFYISVQGGPGNDIASEDYFNSTPLGMIGDVQQLSTMDKSNLVAAVNEVNQKVSSLPKRPVESVNGTHPDETGDVKVLADDLDVEIQEIQFRGSIVDAIKALYWLCVLKVNGKTPNENGAVTIYADDIYTQQGSWYFQGTLLDALDDLHDVLSKLISDSVSGMITSVNGKAGTDGAVTINSDDIPMVDGQWDWGGFTLTEAMDEIMGNIPSVQKINSLIDAKLAQIPFAEGVTFNG